MTSPAQHEQGRLRELGRPAVLIALVAAIALVVLLLPHLDSSSGRSQVTGDPAPVDSLAQCLAAGSDGCEVPGLRECLRSGDAASCEDIIVPATPAASSPDEGAGDALLVGLVVLTPFALVLGPLGLRAARRTRRRNVDAFAVDAEACDRLGFVVAADLSPTVFALEQAWRRATRRLVRPGSRPVWLLEFERVSGLAFDRWPTRSAVFVPAVALPSGTVAPACERGRPARIRSTFGRSPEADAVVEVAGRVLGRYPGQVTVVVAAGLVELRAVAPPRVEPLALSTLGELAIEVSSALELVDEVAVPADAPS